MIPSLLSSYTGSTTAFEFLLAKYQECCEKHTGCERTSSTTNNYPARLIEMSQYEDDLVWLRDTRDFGTDEPYACLSHCWGRKKPLILTQKTKSLLQRGIHISDLPKTFEDAVMVTRKLGIRYIWIDSLYVYCATLLS